MGSSVFQGTAVRPPQVHPAGASRPVGVVPAAPRNLGLQAPAGNYAAMLSQRQGVLSAGGIVRPVGLTRPPGIVGSPVPRAVYGGVPGRPTVASPGGGRPLLH